MLIADYEIFKHDSLLGVLDTETNEIYQMWGILSIREFIEKNINQLWIGFNSDHYDKILAHGMITHKLNTPERVFELSNAIIKAQDDDTPLFGILNKFGISDYYQSPLLMSDLLRRSEHFSLLNN